MGSLALSSISTILFLVDSSIQPRRRHMSAAITYDNGMSKNRAKGKKTGLLKNITMRLYRNIKSNLLSQQQRPPHGAMLHTHSPFQ
jgi:hypothetical protein